MCAVTASVSVRDFYLEQVLPVVVERLDRVFPEFGWRRDRLGWVASDGEFTRSRFGVRPDRVVAHGDAPRGFLIHGGEATLWTAYLNDGAVPRGREFARVVRELADRAGLDARELDRRQPRDRRSDLLEDFFTVCQAELAGERGSSARDYLINARGLPPDRVTDVGLGLVPQPAPSARALVRRGHRGAEITRSGLLVDSRWPGRLCGLWRDERGQARTLWARTVGAAATQEKYLYLRGAKRAGLAPYGFSDAPRQPPGEQLEIVVVEGVLDVHQFRARGIHNVVALGGTSTRPSLHARLDQLGVDRVTLCLDNDQPGRDATAKAIEAATRAAAAPELRVVDPGWLEPHTDPDAYIRHDGTEAWQTLLDNAQCAISWRALELLNHTTPASEPDTRKLALARAGRWLGTLPPRLALEQEDAIRVVAEHCGYTPVAVQRAFVARYWSSPQAAQRPGLQAVEVGR